MERAEKLRELATDVKTAQLVEEMILLESQLAEIKQLPFYKINPNNKEEMKPIREQARNTIIENYDLKTLLPKHIEYVRSIAKL